jgi:predicted transcriptional regulator
MLLLKDVDVTKISPMMQQYFETKMKYRKHILFYRLGDFYEMFFDDAIVASRELELTLTGRDCGLDERAPMCGVPYHAADIYINKLVEKGFLTKERRGDNKKNIYPVVTPLGQQVYDQYSDFIYKFWFREMFEKADAIPEKYVHAFSEILKDMGKSISGMEKSE